MDAVNAAEGIPPCARLACRALSRHWPALDHPCHNIEYHHSTFAGELIWVQPGSQISNASNLCANSVSSAQGQYRPGLAPTLFILCDDAIAVVFGQHPRGSACMTTPSWPSEDEPALVTLTSENLAGFPAHRDRKSGCSPSVGTTTVSTLQAVHWLTMPVASKIVGIALHAVFRGPELARL